MKNVTMLGTDGKQYEVIKILDADTRKPLKGNPLVLIVTEHLEAGLIDSSQVISFDVVPALVPSILEMMDDPERVQSLRTVMLHRA